MVANANAESISQAITPPCTIVSVTIHSGRTRKHKRRDPQPNRFNLDAEQFKKRNRFPPVFDSAALFLSKFRCVHERKLSPGFNGSTITAVPYASTSVTPCASSVVS